MKEALEKILFEGEIEESTIVNLIKQVDELRLINKRQAANLKLILIELCSNIITHHSGTPYCTVGIEATEKGPLLEVSSFVNRHDSEIIETTIKQLKQNKNNKEFYFEKMAGNNDINLSAKLGLVRVYNLCHGEMEIISTPTAGKFRLTFNVFVNDKD